MKSPGIECEAVVLEGSAYPSKPWHGPWMKYKEKRIYLYVLYHAYTAVNKRIYTLWSLIALLLISFAASKQVSGKKSQKKNQTVPSFEYKMYLKLVLQLLFHLL